MTISRRDIMDVYCLVETDYNVSGVLQERPSNQRRKMSTGFQLHRMGYKVNPFLSFESLNPAAKSLYRCLERRYGLVTVNDVHTVGDIQKWYPEATFEPPVPGKTVFGTFTTEVNGETIRWNMIGAVAYLHMPVTLA